MFDFFYLAKRFRNKEMTQKVQVILFSFYLILLALMLSLGAFDPLSVGGTLPQDVQIRTYIRGLTLIPAILMPFTFFLIGNNKGDRLDLISRYILLSFDAYIRYSLLMTLITAIVWAIFTTWIASEWFSLNVILIALGTLVISAHMYFAGKVASGVKS